MDSDIQQAKVSNNALAGRFEVELGSQFGVIEYVKQDSTYIFTHTGIPQEYKGWGIADHMARYALETVRAEGANVIALCPFISAYIRRHKEYIPLVLPVG